MTDVILALNAGSSSLKFSLFVTREGMDTLSLRYRGGVEGLGSEPRFLVDDSTGQRLVDERLTAKIDLFVYRIGRELGSLVASLGGLDALVFTGGIGEHAASIRARVCQDAQWLGVQLDEAANSTGGPKISAGGSAVSVWVIPTDEDLMIACHTKDIIHVTGNHVTTRLDSDMSLC